eukprot:1157521-Pelagomonas_calceolata.AAC.16
MLSLGRNWAKGSAGNAYGDKPFLNSSNASFIQALPLAIRSCCQSPGFQECVCARVCAPGALSSYNSSKLYPTA